ncbi:MAG TPA: SufD family Fe-S cluster assembly protein, partial [Acidimicrobiales bacterium]|nr:SufD family Fe-S cluster assembly protein [Acidimicrobiales bacterium]
EVWRYAPLDGLDLDRYSVPDSPTASDGADDPLAADAWAHVVVVDGFLERVVGGGDGLTVSSATPGDPVVADPDAFSLLSSAMAPATVTLEVAAGAALAAPIVVSQRVAGRSAFPRTRVALGRGASATIVEHLVGGSDSLVAPVIDVELGEGATLRLVTCQRLDATAWHLGRSSAVLGEGASLRQAVIGVGARYDRSRNDTELVGAGSQNELRTTFLGSGDQVHDFRTHQVHRGPRSRSLLLSKGAVGDTSRSIYTGLIEIDKGARKTDARQTNHNLLLSRHAHADSVPNLDIRENDVLCAHASTVGPLDDLQLWYLESRGVDPGRARELLLLGFFLEMLDDMPPSVARVVESDVAATLARVEVSW